MPTITPAACRVPLTVLLLVAGISIASGQDSRSDAAARRLAEVLDRLKLDSIAAQDPSTPETFVAALYFPRAQLLMVSARYSAPSLLLGKLARKDYRDAYIDLNAASVAGSKIFVMDHGANGLAASPGDSGAPDTWEHKNKTTSFDSDWRGAKMSEQEYQKAFAAADEHYARMLTLLAEQATQGGS